jgi:hypothetical protein
VEVKIIHWIQWIVDVVKAVLPTDCYTVELLLKGSIVLIMWVEFQMDLHNIKG